MKSVMKNFKIFFNKYLLPEENHFVQREKQPNQHQYSYQNEQKIQQTQSSFYQSQNNDFSASNNNLQEC